MTMIYGLLRLTVIYAKKFSLMVLFFGMVSPISQAQDKIVDSLSSVLKTTKEDSNRVKTLNAMSERLWMNTAQYDNSRKYAEDALALAQKLNFKVGIARAYNNLGSVDRFLGNYTEALENYSSSKKIAEELGDKRNIAACSSNIGVIYYYEGNYPEALKNYFAALKIWEETGYKKGIANMYNNIGALYAEQGKYAEALQNHFAALKVNEEIGDKNGLSASNNNIGDIYRRQGNYPIAMKYYLVSMKIDEEQGNKEGVATSYNNLATIYELQGNYPEALKNHFSALKMRKEIGEKEEIANSYNNIGIVYKDEANYPEALKYYLSALTQREEIGDKQGIGESYYNIGEVYYLQGNYAVALKQYLASLEIGEDLEDKEGIALASIEIGKVNIKLNKPAEAKKYLDYGLQLAIKTGAKEWIKDAYYGQATLDSATGNYAQSLVHYKLYSAYSDSLLNESNNKQIAQMKEQYESEKKENEIALLNKEKAIQSLDLKHQKLAKNYLIAGIILATILSFFLYRNYRTNQQLKLQTLRNNIASDLHDDVGSTLSSISIFSQMAQQQSKEVIPLLDTIGESSRKMLDAMADIVWTIKPENDQFEKIILRMKSFAFELLGAKNIDFEFQADDDVANMKLSMDVRKNLYLIFKEATNNLVKYSGADRAYFTVKKETNNLTMLIRDNGKGFDMAHVKEGNGLTNMKKRAMEIGAHFMLDSQPGNGTTIQLKLAV